MDTSSSILLLIFLTLLNALFTAAEMSVASSKSFRLEQSSSKGANFAKRLKNNPTNFLSVVQVGITTVVVLTGSLGEETLTKMLTPVLSQYIGVEWLKVITSILVFTVITYITVIFGELIPKSIALRYPEAVASKLAPMMYYLSKVASPIVYILSGSTNVFMKLIGMKAEQENVSEEDVIGMMDEGAQSGAIEQHDREIVERVFELDDQRVHRIMTPRTEWVELATDMTRDEVRAVMRDKQYGRYPVRHDGDYIGVITAHNLMVWLEDNTVEMSNLIVEPNFIPNMVDLRVLLDNFKVRGCSYFVVIDEYHAWHGIVSRYDILQAIVGEMPDRRDAANIRIQQDKVHENEFMIDAATTIHEFRDFFNFEWKFPDEELHTYQTMGGFMMAALGRIPNEQDTFQHENCEFTIIDMDKHVIDKIKVTIHST